MSDFELSRESIEEVLDYSVAVSEFENGVEQRRKTHVSKVIGFKIKTPPLTKTQMQAYRDFLIDKSGALDAFTFTSPFDDVEYNVRFQTNTFRTVFLMGTYQCEFEFKVVL